MRGKNVQFCKLLTTSDHHPLVPVCSKFIDSTDQSPGSFLLLLYSLLPLLSTTLFFSTFLLLCVISDNKRSTLGHTYKKPNKLRQDLNEFDSTGNVSIFAFLLSTPVGFL